MESPQNEKLRYELTCLRSEVQELRCTVDRQKALARIQRGELDRLQNRLQHAEAAAGAASQRVETILNSRIWRTLVRGGQAVLDLYAGWVARRQSARRILSGCAGRFVQTFGTNRDDIKIFCDNPGMSQESVLRQKTQVAGWACARTGVKRIEVRLGDRVITPVETGMTRNDVFQHLPNYPASADSGFKAEFHCSDFPEGRQTLHIIVTAASGLSQTLKIPVIVDHRDEYEIWRTQNAPENLRDQILDNIRLFDFEPLITIVTPVFRTPPELLRACIDSVARQYYSNWQHVLVDDGSNDPGVCRILQDAANADPRVRVSCLGDNRGIAAATNEALKFATGEFVAFLDHDDELSPDALYGVVNELNDRPEWDVFYSDEDKISPDGYHFDGFFKPDWSPDLLHSVNYICHFLVCRRSVLEKAGGLRSGFDGSQDFDLVLRLAEQTKLIRRIPKVLYHWRVSPSSTALDISIKPQASASGLRALNEHLARTSEGAKAVEIFPGHYRVRYPLQENPRVAVIIPSAGNPLLEGALQGLLDGTDYPNIETLVIDNGKGDRVRDIVSKFHCSEDRIRMVDCRRLPFNFSLLCNSGARTTNAQYLLFLNDDTSVIHQDWLEAMMEHAKRPEVGAVGSLLLFPDDRIQHAGVLMGIYGLAGHSFRLLDSRESHYFHLPVLTRNCAAVTGACLLTRADVFWQVGGFEERELPMAFQDVDLCLKLHERGYRIIYTPHARLYHHESATKTLVAYQSEIDYMKTRWRRYIDDDPYYNPNLTRSGEGYAVSI